MTKKDTLAALAERMYVIEQMTINELASQLQVHEKTIRNWKEEFGWDKKRAQFLSSKAMFHEELYNFARKLMSSIEYDIANKLAVFGKSCDLTCLFRANAKGFFAIYMLSRRNCFF